MKSPGPRWAEVLAKLNEHDIIGALEALLELTLAETKGLPPRVESVRQAQQILVRAGLARWPEKPRA